MVHFFEKFFVVLGIVLLAACSEESDPDVVLYPDGDGRFMLYPNEGLTSDSVDANLVHGVLMRVHPKANYELSFEVDSTADEPQLQLFRLWQNERTGDSKYGLSQVRVLEPKIVGNHYVFSFNCEENGVSLWMTSLAVGSDFYSGHTRHTKLVGEGGFSDHLALNLIQVGDYDALAVGVLLDSLASEILQTFRRYYKSVNIDTIYIRYAHEHPTVGKNYPADEPWVAGRSSDDIYLTELGGWPEKALNNALDLVLVHRIAKDGVTGISGLFSANLGGGEGSTVVIATHFGESYFEKANSSSDIAMTAVHEAGHFFGLRHTTATESDLMGTEDYSVYEDGFEDTPNCAGSGVVNAKIFGDASTDIVPATGEFLPSRRMNTPLRGKNLPSRGLYRVQFTADGFGRAETKCPDVDNIMYPIVENVTEWKLSAQQLAFLRKNLMLIPH